MSLLSPNEKGDALEVAVSAIEHAILSNSPSLSGAPLFERKKRVNCDGVHHEIDLYLTIDSGAGYKATFIFECKNWQEAVGKNEIIVFARKIHDVSAQLGYFIAKSFTADAVAAAAQDKRIVLYIAIEHDPSNEAVEFYMRIPVMTCLNASFAAFGTSGKEYKATEVGGVEATYLGKIVKLKDLIEVWSMQACEEEFAAFFDEAVPEGVYSRPPVLKTRGFPPDEFVIEGKSIQSAVFYIEYLFKVARSPLVSHFEIQTRGRCYSFAPLQTPDGPMQFNVVLPEA
jgi:hypothetical protein